MLERIDFEIRPGEILGIAGVTGAGKSTLLNLIPRFYDPRHGRVLIDGVDVKDWDLIALRRYVGTVFQESFLFSDSVAANIAFGRPHSSQREIERAARLAAVHEDIEELPQGYETVIGEQGTGLSGGQRQRLALARALIVEPAILILDDALAAVDPQTAHAIFENLKEARAGRTTLIAAHSRGSLAGAHRIIELDRGALVATEGAPPPEWIGGAPASRRSVA